MRKFGLVIAAFVAAALGAPAGATATFTAEQYAKAAAGLDAMKKLNLLVLGDATLHSDVEGKVYVGGNLSGNSATIDKGGSAGKTSKADAKYRALTVGGNLTSGVNINNGAGLGALEAVVGGDATGVVMNLGSAASAKLMVGGAFNAQNFNPNSKKTAVYGKSASNTQTQDAPYIKQDLTLKVGGLADMKAGIARQTATYTTELLQLSQILGALTPNAVLISSDQNNIHFDFTATPGAADYAVVNVTSAQAAKLASGTFVMPTYAAAKTLVINVAGATVNMGANETGSPSTEQQNIIWNFTDATTINVNNALYGSVLAPKATVQGNGSPIAGSVVAKVFNANGEVHLGTFAGHSGFLVTVPPSNGGGGGSHEGTPGAIPEPSSWMTMLLGFGFLGSIIRRQRRKERLAAA